MFSTLAGEIFLPCGHRGCSITEALFPKSCAAAFFRREDAPEVALFRAISLEQDAAGSLVHLSLRVDQLEDINVHAE